MGRIRPDAAIAKKPPMSSPSQQIVQTLWRYCNILRDDGLSYPDYVEQLTYLLFLKLAYERRKLIGQAYAIPAPYNWNSLVSISDKTRLYDHYGAVLRKLSAYDGMLGIIFFEAANKIRDPAKLSLLINDLIDKKRWSELDADIKGDAYEGLLEKNAQDTKSGAGQYFTPRPVIRAIIDVIRPQITETVCDPACGTCGFLLAAIDHVRNSNRDLTPRQLEHIRLKMIHGTELVPAVARLGAMNLFLHGIGPSVSEAPSPVTVSDSLSTDPGDRFDVVVTNPPFGRKSSVTFLHDVSEQRARDLSVSRPDFWATTSNKQLNFLQHVNTILARPGRAAVVVPDNVLFESGAGERIRRRMLHDCNVHTLLRLPSGIFYAGGVNANVLFFDKDGGTRQGDALCMWVYDLRTDFRVTLRSKPIQRPDLEEFVRCYRSGNMAGRRETWSEANPEGRWRRFPYDEIVQRKECSFDISWLGREAGQDRLNPAQLAAEIVEDLRSALSGLEAVAREMNRPEQHPDA